MRFFPKVVLIVLFCLSSFPANSEQLQATIVGQLLTRDNNLPAPGLVVSLVHPFLGRSVPTSSDVYGRFTFFGIPLNRDPYYIEVYWGSELIYRQSIFVGQDHINLPPIYL